MAVEVINVEDSIAILQQSIDILQGLKDKAGAILSLSDAIAMLEDGEVDPN